VVVSPNGKHFPDWVLLRHQDHPTPTTAQPFSENARELDQIGHPADDAPTEDDVEIEQVGRQVEHICLTKVGCYLCLGGLTSGVLDGHIGDVEPDCRSAEIGPGQHLVAMRASQLEDALARHLAGQLLFEGFEGNTAVSKELSRVAGTLARDLVPNWPGWPR
jgi:hypothetical protein